MLSVLRHSGICFDKKQAGRVSCSRRRQCVSPLSEPRSHRAPVAYINSLTDHFFSSLSHHLQLRPPKNARENEHVLSFLFAPSKSEIDLEIDHGVGRSALLILHPCFRCGTKIWHSENGCLRPSPRFLKISSQRIYDVDRALFSLKT